MLAYVLQPGETKAPVGFDPDVREWIPSAARPGVDVPFKPGWGSFFKLPPSAGESGLFENEIESPHLIWTAGPAWSRQLAVPSSSCRPLRTRFD